LAVADTRHTTTVDIKVDDREVTRLADELNRTFDTRIVETFNKMLERQSSVIGTLIKQQAELHRTMQRQNAMQPGSGGSGGGGQGGGGGHGGGGDHPSWWNRVSATGVGTYLGHQAHEIGHGLKAMPAAAAGGEFSKAAARLMPVAGETLAGTMEAAQKYHHMAMANLNARMGAFGAAGIGGESMRALGKWGATQGIDPDALPGMLGGVARQTGLSGRDLIGASKDVISAQRFLGIEGAGTVTGAAGAAGGDVSAQRSNALLAQTIGTAVTVGVQESRLDEYFQGVAGFVEQMRNRGMAIEPESVNALVGGFGAINAKSLSGIAGLNAIKSMAGGVAGAMSGTSIMSAIMMQTTGVSGGKNIFQARREVEDKPLEAIAAAIEAIKKMMPATATNAEARGGMMREVLKSSGINVSGTQAYDLMRGEADLEDVFGAAPAAEAAKTGKKLMNRRVAMAGSMTKDLQVEAGIKQQAINLGEKEAVKHLAHHLEALDQQIAKKILPSMSHFTNEVLKLVDKLINAYPGLKLEAKKLGQEAVDKTEHVIGTLATTGQELTDEAMSAATGEPTPAEVRQAEDDAYQKEQLLRRIRRDKNATNPEMGDTADPNAGWESSGMTMPGGFQLYQPELGGGPEKATAAMRKAAELINQSAGEIERSWPGKNTLGIDTSIPEGGGGGGL
jgi:hypothetical protein